MPAGGSPLPPTPAAPPPRKSKPGSTWTDQETLHLIDVYEERWYALKRGQLKAQQWEEVSAEVAFRCDLSPPSKNGTQCRHKIEKLRKRYRSERLRPARSAWPFFDRVDRMECGPIPISDEDADSGDPRGNNTRSVSGILRESAPWVNSGVLVNLGQRKRRAEERDEDEDEEEEEDIEEEMEDDDDGGAVGEGMAEMAVVLRNFGDGYVKMERRRMEIVREIELERMEMEAKKMEMIMEAQRCFLEMIAGMFSKKGKNSVEM